jgi:hypothetical protein
MQFIFIGFMGNSSWHCQRRMLQEFGRRENHRFGAPGHRSAPICQVEIALVRWL